MELCLVFAEGVVTVGCEVMYREQIFFNLRCVYCRDSYAVILRIDRNGSSVRDASAMSGGGLCQCPGATLHVRVGCSGMRRVGTGV